MADQAAVDKGFQRVKAIPPGQPKSGEVQAHLVADSLHIDAVKNELKTMGAKMSMRDGVTLVEGCAELGHHEGLVFIHKNGSIVLWDAATAAFAGYRKVMERHATIPLKLPKSMIAEFSETIDVVDGDRSCMVKGVLHLGKDHTIAEKIAVSLAMMSAVKLNNVELTIRQKIVVSNAELDRLRQSMSRRNLDKLAERLFEYQTFAHHTRYWLNLEHDLLEIPDSLWEEDHLRALFRATQAVFDMPPRLEKLNHRISWQLESLQSHSEFVRHKHSSRLEKIIILVIIFELALGLTQALYKLV